jgi:hypothetical protein
VHKTQFRNLRIHLKGSGHPTRWWVNLNAGFDAGGGAISIGALYIRDADNEIEGLGKWSRLDDGYDETRGCSIAENQRNVPSLRWRIVLKGSSKGSAYYFNNRKVSGFETTRVRTSR